MKYLLALLLLACLYIQCGTTNNSNPQMIKDTNDFETLWAKIDSLEKEGLYASALRETEILLTKGRFDNAKNHVIKALFYKAKYNISLQEDSAESTLIEFETELAKEDNKSYQRIYHSILGQLYTQYAQYNQYKIRNRTSDKSVDDQNIAEMSMAQLINKSNTHFLESVSDITNEDLELQNYDILIDKKQMKYEEIDLYSLLLIRTLHHFKNDMHLLTQPVYASNLYATEAFGDIETFLQYTFEENGVDKSFQTRSLQLYQKLLTYHRNDSIVDKLNVERLNYVHQIHKAADKTILYRTSLLDLANKSNHAKLASAELDYNAYDKTIVAQSKNVNARNALQEIINEEDDQDLVNKATRILQTIEQPLLNLGVEKVILPLSPSLYFIEFKNLDEISFTIKKSSEEIYQKLTQLRKQEEQLTYIKSLPTETSWSQNLPDSKFTNLSSELRLPALPIGQYIILAESDRLSSYSQILVSKLSYVVNNGKDEVQYTITDRETGMPLEGVAAELYERRYNRGQQTKSIIATKVSDKEGQVKHNYTGKTAVCIRLESNGDVLDLQQGINPIYDRSQPNRQTIHTFTDRNIYRPGQRVYLKAILLQSNEDGLNPASAVVNERLTLTAYDVNRQEVHNVELKTNKFGSLSTDFMLPKSGLAGQYSLEIVSDSGARSYTAIRVEEYKRPTFYSELLVPDAAFQLGDSITIAGKSAMFSGSPVDDGIVEYRVTRNQIRYYDWYRYASSYGRRGGQSGESAEITYGTTRTNSIGEFEIDFILKEGSVDQFNPNPVYIFSIEITTTDSSGETNSYSKSISVSRKAIFISTDIPENLDLEKRDSLKIFSKNISNLNIAFSGRIIIHSLQSPTGYKKPKYWSDLDTMILDEVDYNSLPDEYQFNLSNPKLWAKDTEVFSTEFTSDGEYALKIPSGLTAGYYSISIQNAANDSIEYETITRVYDFNRSKFDATQLFEHQLNKENYEINDVVQLTIGSAQKAVYVYYQLEKDSRIVDAQWLRLNENSKQLRIPVEEPDKGGFMVHLTSFYKNRIQQERIPIQVPYTDKLLKLNIESFKSTLEPGSEEEWTISIVDHNDKPVAAELLASMYDASLDALGYPNVWQQFNFVQYRSKINHMLPGYQLQYFRYLKYWRAQYYDSIDPNAYYPDFNFFGYSLASNQMARGGRVMKSRSTAPAPMSMESSMDAAEVSMSDQNATEEVENTNESVGDESQDIDWSSVREVLDETVFFFPYLVTNQDGNTTIKFKMSEALSSWNLQVFVHDAEARYGYSQFELKTQKDVSIFPNVPRFLRVGDKLRLAGKIVNNTNTNVKTSTTIQFINPDTNEDVTSQVIDAETTNHHSVKSNASIPVTWSIAVDETMLAGLIYRMRVGHEYGSDAIEGFIPVTTNRVLVTESLPLYVAADQSKQFSFDALDRVRSSKSANVERYTIEYTANPSWYVFQALPYLASPEMKSSTQILNQYVSHHLAKTITSRTPQLKSMLQHWERTATSAENSPLRRNADLKLSALESTPWLRQSISEEEQRARLIEFYNQNQSEAVLNNALSELLTFQNPDGGFSWLPGRPSSRFISATILENIGRLDMQGVAHDIPDHVIVKTIAYIDKAIDKIAKSLNDSKSYYSSPLHLLFARSYYASSHKITDGFKVLLEKSVEKWQKKSLHEQAQIALISNRLNQNDTASKILNSLQEQMIMTEDKGAYWKLNRSYYSNHSSIDKQVLMIELFHELHVEQHTIDQLRVWLLRNKQTNHWKTNQSTASAVYAFMMNHNSDQSDWINNARPAEIQIGNTVLDAHAESAALYLKKDIDISQMNTTSSKIDIVNPNKQSGWGAAYIQYYDDISKIDGNALHELSIQKEMFKQVMTDEGPVLKALTESKLLPGDKLVVKLIIQSDRSLEYVQIRDERGSGLEPADVLSGFTQQDALHYYQETKDASSNFYISNLPRGTHVLEYTLKANLVGLYTTGMATIQCMYAPEFTSHSNSINIELTSAK